MWITATAPFILILIFLGRALTLPGAGIGIHYYLKVDSSKLFNTETWLAAGTQIFWSFSICLSAHTSLGSYNKKNNDTYHQCVLLGLLNSATSFVAGFVVFAVIGFMAREQGLDTIENVVKAGPGLAFQVYPKAILMMPQPRVWGALFFLMIFFLGIDSQFVCTEGIVTSIMDVLDYRAVFIIHQRGVKYFVVAYRGVVNSEKIREIKKYNALYKQRKNKDNATKEQKIRKYTREILVFAICLVSYLIGISMVTRNGIYVLKNFESSTIFF